MKKKSLRDQPVFALFLMAVIFMLALFPSCKKSGQNDNSGSGDLKKLLTGQAGRVWQLQSVDVGNVWEDQLGKGWVQYTNQPGTINLSSCVLDNDYIVFNADNTYTQSTYICNLFETNFILFKQTGGPGNWTLAADNTLRLENYATYRLISVTGTDLFIADLYGTYHFASVTQRPFLTPVQNLAGSGSRTWKVRKITRGGVEQPLTAAQISNRLSFNSSGALTSSYTDPSFGLPLTGVWSFNLPQSKYIYGFPANGASPAVDQTCTLLELTNNTFSYYFFDKANNYFTVYLIPQ